jgi:hypothetical protein
MYPWCSVANSDLNFRQLLSEIIAHRIILDSEAPVAHSEPVKRRFELKFVTDLPRRTGSDSY